MTANTKAHIALFFVALFYGANYSIAKIAMDDAYVQPLAFILMRMMCGVLFFWFFHYLFIKEKVERKDFPLLFLCAVFGAALNQLLFFSGLHLTTPINGSLIMTTTPILVLLASAFLIKEKVTLRKSIGVTIGALGAVLLIAYGKKVDFSSDQMLGDLMIFANAAAYGIYLVLVKSLTRKYHPLTIVKWVFTFGIVLVFPFGIQQLLVIDWSSFTTLVWLAVAYVLIFTTVLNYLFNAYALSIVNASTVSAYIYLQPFFATLIALFLQADQLDGVKLLSAFFIFIGVYLVSFSATNDIKNKKTG